MRERRFDPTLYLVIDPEFCLHSPEEIALQAIHGGVTLLQLRSKTESTRDLIALATRLKKISDRFGIPLLINDRVDVVLATHASGVHLGQKDLHPLDARRMLGNEAIIGFSVSNVTQAKEASDLPVDYLGAGPVFQTLTKDAVPLSSLQDLREICTQSKQPVVGIGGINAENASSVRKAGAKGIAVVSAICSQEKPREMTKRLKEIQAHEDI